MKLRRGQRLKATLVTTTYSMKPDDQLIYCTDAGGSFTLTLLPVASASGKRIWIKKTNSSTNVITISATSIDGVTDTTINTQNECLQLFCDGSAWYIVERYTDRSWISFTPTGGWNTNVTYAGFWRRIGDSMELQMGLVCSGAPNAVAATFNMPTGYTIDTNKLLAQSATYYPILGNCIAFRNTGSHPYMGHAAFSTASIIAAKTMTTFSSVVPELVDVGTTSPMTWAANDRLQITALVPISGWK